MPSGVTLIQNYLHLDLQCMICLCSGFAFLITFCFVIKFSLHFLNIHLLHVEGDGPEACWKRGQLAQLQIHQRQATEQQQQK